MAAAARSVSLFNCEDRIYSAVEVGSAKKTIPTWKGCPVRPIAFMEANPMTGRIANLKMDAVRDRRRWVLMPSSESAPPMEISASGKVT